MLTIKEIGLLKNIIEHSKRIEEKVAYISKEKFLEDKDLLEIVCFNILQIGELAKNFDDAFIFKNNEVPWKQIKGMRDKVAHGYGTIDKEKVWETALSDVMNLGRYCQTILDRNKT